MPKVIENVREMLLAEARKQVAEIGYSAMTIRSVATACHIATGTVYNYFPSKDVMVATYMAEEWMEDYNQLMAACQATESVEEILTIAFEGVRGFRNRHEQLFSDQQAEVRYARLSGDRHKMLRDQVARLIEPACQKARNPDPFLRIFIAESFLSWASEDIPTTQIVTLLKQFF